MIILKGIGLLFLLAFTLILIYLLLLPLGAIIPVNLKYRPSKNGVDIYLSTNGMHIDFIVPTQNQLFNWSTIVNDQPFAQPIADYPYLGIGWGDWNFYIELDEWKNLSVKLATQALFNPNTQTLMHITGYDQLPTEQLRVAKVSLSNKQYQQLCQFILTGFALDQNQEMDLLPNLGYTAHDNFYKAHGRYHALHTCNYWVNKGLKRIGVRTALWSPLDRGVFYQLEKIKSAEDQQITIQAGQ